MVCFHNCFHSVDVLVEGICPGGGGGGVLEGSLFARGGGGGGGGKYPDGWNMCTGYYVND